jgi:large subunit ribosomal protein L18e
VRLFKFLSRRTDSKFCKTILRRLVASRTNRPPVSLSKLVRHLGTKKTDRTVVVVGTITDDSRILEIPKLNVAALHVTETARSRIVAAGGSCQTIDELIMKSPTGSGTLLLRGPTMREAKHFGPAPGVPGSHTKPYVRSKGRKFEAAKCV